MSEHHEYLIGLHHYRWMLARAKAREDDALNNGLFPKTEFQHIQWEYTNKVADMMSRRMASRKKNDLGAGITHAQWFNAYDKINAAPQGRDEQKATA